MPTMPAIFDKISLELRQASNTTTLPAWNRASLTIDETLQCLPLPYGLIGITLQLIVYYSCFCVLVLQQSPCLLVFKCRSQRLQHHGINICLCCLEVFATVALMAATHFSVCVSNALGHFVAVNFILTLVCANVIGVHANHSRLRLSGALSELQETLDLVTLGLGITGLFIFEVLGLISAAQFVRAGWDKPVMRVVCIAPMVMQVAGALVLAGNLTWGRYQSIRDILALSRATTWVLGVVSMVMLIAPLFLDALLAVRAENSLGAPLGRDGKVVGIYVAYVISSLLPFFCT